MFPALSVIHGLNEATTGAVPHLALYLSLTVGVECGLYTQLISVSCVLCRFISLVNSGSLSFLFLFKICS